jgi:hypothetical protein
MEVFGRAKRPFLRQFLRLKHGIPSHDTFSRVFRQLDPKPFQACFVRFMERFAQGLGGVIAVDGKSLRGSFDRASGKSPLHMVHAWAVDQRLCLARPLFRGQAMSPFSACSEGRSVVESMRCLVAASRTAIGVVHYSRFLILPDVVKKQLSLPMSQVHAA